MVWERVDQSTGACLNLSIYGKTEPLAALNDNVTESPHVSYLFPLSYITAL